MIIFRFELERIRFLCDLTNDQLEFETDSSIKEQFIEAVERTIKQLEANRFDYKPAKFENPYDEFNSIIDNCIVALRKKIECEKKGLECKSRIRFDADKYKSRVYEPRKEFFC